ncbi:amidase [Litorimonas haliclonae]|uniref:amidase n=1 Tax=Litorimonas haliclonae TaxID=2081977 RepID=UPI0039EEB802
MTEQDINAVLTEIPTASKGKTVGVKANIAVKGYACHGGIKAYERDIAKSDAVVVQRLRGAGINPTAILNMEEGALGAQTDNPWFGKTHNPLKYGYTPGGSSGGSAAAVAAHQVDIALGTDTMGSVRIPSAYCGLWGFKPSHDDEMLTGVMPLSPTLDTVGVHAHSFEDVVRGTEIICSRHFGGGKAGKIHLLNYKKKVDCEAGVQEIFEAFLAKQGRMEPTQLGPYAFGKSRRAGLILSEVEGYKFHKSKLEEDPEGFSNFFRGMMEYGSNLPQEKVKAAYAHVKELREADFPDFILMPTAPQTAFKFGSPVPANQADFTAFANLSDRPAIQFPIGITANGLPVGAQLVGPRGREADLVESVKSLTI